MGEQLHLHWRCQPALARQDPLCDAHVLLPCGAELQVSALELRLLPCWLRCAVFAAAAALQQAPQPCCVQSQSCLQQSRKDQ